MTAPVANPFDFETGTPFGALRVRVRPGRSARIQCVADAEGEKRTLRPLTVGGGLLLVVADVSHDGVEWTLGSFTAAPPPGAGPADLERAKEILLDGISPVLDGLMRRFVERDIVEVYRERRVQDDAIAQVVGEIERRRLKVKAMRKARGEAEVSFGEREAALRGEMEGLSHPEADEPEMEEAPAMVA